MWTLGQTRRVINGLEILIVVIILIFNNAKKYIHKPKNRKSSCTVKTYSLEVRTPVIRKKTSKYNTGLFSSCIYKYFSNIGNEDPLYRKSNEDDWNYDQSGYKRT